MTSTRTKVSKWPWKKINKNKRKNQNGKQLVLKASSQLYYFGKMKLITFSCILLDIECKRSSNWSAKLGTQYNVYKNRNLDDQVGLDCSSAKIE